MNNLHQLCFIYGPEYFVLLKVNENMESDDNKVNRKNLEFKKYM